MVVLINGLADRQNERRPSSGIECDRHGSGPPASGRRLATASIAVVVLSSIAAEATASFVNLFCLGSLSSALMMKSVSESLFDEIEKYFSATEKYIEDIKWMIGIMGAFFLALLSVLTLTMSWNLNQEKLVLQNIKKEIKGDINRLREPAPDVKILRPNGLPLNGQDVAIEIGFNEPKLKWPSYVKIPRFIIKNQGANSSGNLYFKVYTDDPFGHNPSTDEKDYKYETYIFPEYLDEKNIPGENFSMSYYLSFRTDFDIASVKRVNRMLIKMYNERQLLDSAKFNGILEK